MVFDGDQESHSSPLPDEPTQRFDFGCDDIKDIMPVSWNSHPNDWIRQLSNQLVSTDLDAQHSVG